MPAVASDGPLSLFSPSFSAAFDIVLGGSDGAHYPTEPLLTQPIVDVLVGARKGCVDGATGA